MTESEFTDLIGRLRPELVRIANHKCGRDYAEDAVQTAVFHCWNDQGWKGAGPYTVTRWLRRLAGMRGRDQLRSLGRFRALQKEVVVLANNGGTHTPARPRSDDQGLDWRGKTTMYINEEETEQ